MDRKHVVMVASENDALIGGKVGGVGDVVRNLPKALARLGWRVTVIIPSYGFLHTSNSSKLLAHVAFPFGGKQTEGEMWHADPKEPVDHVSHLLFEHPDLKGDPIYFNDPSDSPFMRDATKYALFCSAVGQFLKTLDQPFTLHLHDWHTGVLLLLRERHPEFTALKKIPTCFTIHNLAIQGTRPMLKHQSSVECWFPELFSHAAWISEWKDPRYKEPTFTPMAAGIQYTGKVNTVSPTYAEEILKPNDPRTGFHGGEGLEGILLQAKTKDRLFGILNGCEYPGNRTIPKISSSDLYDHIAEAVASLKKKNVNYEAGDLLERIRRFRANPPSIMLTSVTRVVEQKVGLFFERTGNRIFAIDEIMNLLEQRNGVYILLGSGTPDYEQRVMEAEKKHDRLIFIQGYSERLSLELYANGTLFLMPSLFEPCGISQMLAMRDGQPCVVNAVGGLRDTVMSGVNGFTFYGDTMQEKADGFVLAARKAMDMYFQNKALWEKITIEAGKARFTWEQTARQYIELLYA
jgi:starch synthase